MNESISTPRDDRRIDELLDAATRRLRPDPDLRLEVRQELAGHLHDSVQESIAAGIAREEAVGQAIQEFGDPVDVADGLWETHRRRTVRSGKDGRRRSRG